MNITDVHIKLADGRSNVKAYATMTIDNAFVVRDIKIIDSRDGWLLAMPSRTLTKRCRCGQKNHLLASYCNACGADVKSYYATPPVGAGWPRLHADVAHPINQQTRELVEEVIFDAYEDEIAKKDAA